jgi:hypothetical protein
MIKKAKIGLIVLVLSFIAVTPAKTQVKFFKLNAGFGIWEQFHAGFDYRIKSYSFGIDAGTFLRRNAAGYADFSITLDNSYFWGKPNKENIKRWYLNGRLIFLRLTTPQSIFKLLFFCPSIGREFYFSSKHGLNIDIGPAIVTIGNRQDRPGSPKVGWIYPVYPECRIEYFYRF